MARPSNSFATLILLSWIILLNLLLSMTSQAREILLSPRKSMSLPASSGLNIEVEDSQVIQVKDLGEKLQVTGKKIGETELWIGDSRHQVQVIPKSVYRTFHVLHTHFKETSSLKVGYQKQRVILSGEILNVRDWKRLWSLPPTESSWQLAAQVPERLRPLIQEQFLKQLQSLYLPPARLVFHSTIGIFLAEEHASYQKIFEKLFSPFGLAVTTIAHSSEPPPLLRIEILIAEVKTGHLRKFGLQWPSQLRAQVVPDFLWQDDDGEGSLLKANLLESRGWGQVLASPSLVCQSGQQAEFMAGGEIPIPTSYGHDVIWKKHGLSLKVQPTVSHHGNMQIQLSTEVSALDYSTAIEGVPGLTTNRLATSFTLNRSQPIVLSGLFKKDYGDQVDGLPWLSRIPILGPLFSSRTFQNNQTELVIVVLPRLVDLNKELALDRPHRQP